MRLGNNPMIRFSTDVLFVVLAAVVPVLTVSCGSFPEGSQWGVENPSRNSWDSPPLSAVARIVEAESALPVSLDRMMSEVEDAEVVFLGETHLDESTHRFEHAVYEELIARRGKVVLALEMFERDAQGVLDDYLAGRIDEAEFKKKAGIWHNYSTDYRPLIETARREGLPVVASNTPRGPRKKVAFGGKEAFDRLSEEEKAWFPPELYAHPQSYWDRFNRAVRGHMGAMFKSRTPEQMIYSSQSLWDNTMAFSCAEALLRYPDHIVLHVNGGFHSAYGEGTVYQLRKRRPDVRIKTISITPVSDLSALDPSPGSRVADYVAYVESRARSSQDRFLAVEVSTELRYQLHVPKGVDESVKLPLLIVLPPAGLRADDAMKLWRLIVGDRAIVVAVEPPVLSRGEDLHLGGSWFLPDHFTADLGRLQDGLGRICHFVQRHHTVDPERIVFAGEGDAGMVVAFAALYDRSLTGKAIALSPSHGGKLSEISVPSPPSETEGRFAPKLELTVMIPSDQIELWEGQLPDFRAVGCRAKSVSLPDSVSSSGDFERAVLTNLGFPGSSQTSSGSETHFVIRTDSPRSAYWARVAAKAWENAHGTKAIVSTEAEFASILGAGKLPEKVVLKPLSFQGEPFLSDVALDSTEGLVLLSGFSASDLLEANAVPVPDGAFGGTTVLLVPEGVSSVEKEAFRKLEEAQPVRKRNSFSRLKVVFLDEKPELGTVLATLAEEGVKNVLLVPAVFCSSPQEMRHYEKIAGKNFSGMNLSWLPGLGRDLHVLFQEKS